MSGNWDRSPPKLLIQSATVPLPCLMKGGGYPDPSHKEAGSLLTTSSKMNKRDPTVRSNTWGKLPGCQSTLSKALGCAFPNNYSVGFMQEPRVLRHGFCVHVFTPANLQNSLITSVYLALSAICKIINITPRLLIFLLTTEVFHGETGESLLCPHDKLACLFLFCLFLSCCWLV